MRRYAPAPRLSTPTRVIPGKTDAAHADELCRQPAVAAPAANQQQNLP